MNVLLDEHFEKLVKQQKLEALRRDIQETFPEATEERIR